MANTHSLFTPAKLGPITLPNRIVMASMTTRQADKDGYVTNGTLRYYQARARGGVGLITVEMAAPEKVGRHRHNELGLYDDQFLDGLRSLVDVIHAEGAKAAIQIGHGGGHTRIDICGEEPIAPSAVIHSVHEGHTELIVPQAMSVERIKQTQQSYVAAAKRARAAGFDAVEIHGAHGYLLSQFLSSVENKRDDEYGNSFKNRARFSIEITRLVKEAVPDLAVIFRMNGDDFFSGGMELNDAIELARWIEEAGADAIHVTAGHYRSQPDPAIMIPPMAAGTTPFRPFAKAIKQMVKIPVISVGRYGNPQDAFDVIAAGDADFIALGRPLLADPEWVHKAKNSVPPRPCIACNSCVDGMRDGHKLHCLVNPETGHEIEYQNRKLAMQGGRIAVIGAGPAGLSFAALMAGENQVTIFEKENQIGGSFLFAGYAPKFQTVNAVPDTLQFYVNEMKRICDLKGVEFQTGFDPISQPSSLKPSDWVVIATGAKIPFGLQKVVSYLLKNGFFKTGLMRKIASNPIIRDLFYTSLRTATGRSVRNKLNSDTRLSIIGDAAQAGKASEAIKSAYALAYSRIL